MFGRLRKALVGTTFARSKDLPREASPVPSFDPADRDGQLSGWFRTDTRELIEGFPITATDEVLDLGCGEGQHGLFCAQLGASVVCADVKPDCIRAVDQLFAAADPDRYKTLLTDANPLPLESASFDKLIASEVLEHVEDPAMFLSEMVRVARPGALFLLTVPAPASEAVQQELAPGPYFEKPNHIRIFTESSFGQLVVDAGLQVVSRKQHGFYHAFWWTLFWTCDQELAPPWHPLLESWSSLWGQILQTRDGPRIKEALDRVMPKSQVIIARKPQMAMGQEPNRRHSSDLNANYRSLI